MLNGITARLAAAAWAGLAVLVPRARALDPAVPAHSYIIQEWQTETGLPSNRVRGIAEAPDGYLWIGTERGLARFDGSSFKAFDGSTNPELKRAFIFGLEQTPDGTLWLATNDGLYRRRDGRFDRVSLGDDPQREGVRSLALLPDHTLVAGAAIATCTIVGGQVAAPPQFQQQITGNVRAFAQAPDGSFYVGGEKGLCRITPAGVERLSETKTFPGVTYSSFLTTPDRRFWIGSNVGLHAIDPDGTVRRYGSADGLTNLRVQCLARDRAGNLWVGTSGGLFRWQGKRFEPAAYAAFGAGTIMAMLEDRDGSLWIGSSLGLFRLRDNAVQTIGVKDGLKNTAVHGVLAGHDGKWRLGTWGGGLYEYDGTKARVAAFSKGPAFDQIYAITEDRDGQLWVGAGGGLFVVSPNGVTDCTLRDPALLQQPPTAWKNLSGILHPRVNDLVPSRDGGLIIGTRGAVYRAHEGRFDVIARAGALANGDFRSMAEMPDGTIWALTPTSVGRLADGQWIVLGESEGVHIAHPHALYVDTTGVLWLVTDGEGVYRLKDGRWRHYTTGNGLIDDEVVSIVEHHGTVWLGSSRGLMFATLAEFDRVDAGAPDGLKVRTLTRAEGLPISECNGQGRPSLATTPDGRVLVATELGVAVVDPAHIPAPAEPPPVRVDVVTVGERDWDPQASITLPPNHPGVQFKYGAIKLTAPEKTRYRVKLEPIDDDWHDAADRREIRFARLKHGRYVFHVAARNLDGPWNPVAASVAFAVRPFFYQTLWFQVGVASAGLVLAFGAYRWRLRRLRRHARELERQNSELERRVTERTTELSQTNDSLRRAQRELIEASRRAGIAETAAGVLHNIGNALNSVNTSAGVSLVRVKQMKISGLSRVAALIAEQGERLPEFFATDARARQVPDYLVKCAAHLLAEQSAVVEELGEMSGAIERINTIVASQEAVARVPGVAEEVAPAELVDFACRVAEAPLNEAGVRVHRTVEALPSIKIDRHKATQILLSLLRHGAESCRDAADKQLVIGLRGAADGRIVITVRDHGRGFEPDDLARLFAFGAFENGAYAGALHTSALAAKELGGELTAISDGPGRGATFTLVLPPHPPAA